MKVIISSTYDDNYLFFIPLVTWGWNRIGVDVICFFPSTIELRRHNLIFQTIIDNKIRFNHYYFSCPEYKEATYAQCSRLYAASLDLPENEVLVTSDVDMIIFAKDYISQKESDFDIFGSDLVPEKQIPICYISASVKNWRRAMDIGDETYQECLDELVGVIECQDFRGNQWSLDQHTAYQKITSAPVSVHHHFRARPGTQFSSKRYDRDDAYILDRLNLDTIDFHLPRPGYLPNNLNIILEVMKYHYPLEDFDWVKEYAINYIKLLS